VVPAPNGGEDLVGIGDPLEWLGPGVVIFEEAIDRGPVDFPLISIASRPKGS
jgi:hypothetical protein